MTSFNFIANFRDCPIWTPIVDGAELLHQLSLVVYPFIIPLFIGFYTSHAGGFLAGFLNHQQNDSMSLWVACRIVRNASDTKSETCSRFYWTLVLPLVMVPEFGWVLMKDWSIILEMVCASRKLTGHRWLENWPGLKMYFLAQMGILQQASW